LLDTGLFALHKRATGAAGIAPYEHFADLPLGVFLSEGFLFLNKISDNSTVRANIVHELAFVLKIHTYQKTQMLKDMGV
jgi:hypothetical protein